MAMIPSSIDAKWPFRLITPPGQAVAFIAEEMKIGGLTKRALGALEVSRGTLLLAGAAFAQLGNSKGVAAVGQALSEQPFNELWAREEREKDFTTLNRHMLIALWGVTEVALEDSFVELVMHDNAAIPALVKLGMKLPRDIKSPPSESDARRCYQRIFKVFDQDPFSRRILKIFTALGLPLNTTASDCALLDEANAVRNALLHRGGLIDDFAVVQAPALAGQKGTKLEVGEAFLAKVHPAISGLAVELIRSASEYIKRAAGFVEPLVSVDGQLRASAADE